MLRASSIASFLNFLVFSIKEFIFFVIFIFIYEVSVKKKIEKKNYFKAFEFIVMTLRNEIQFKSFNNIKKINIDCKKKKKSLSIAC